MTNFWDTIDRHFVIRRIAFLVMLGMTVKAFFWAMTFAETSERGGTELALVIAAVTAPIAFLQKAIVELYNAARLSN